MKTTLLLVTLLFASCATPIDPVATDAAFKAVQIAIDEYNLTHGIHAEK